MYEPLENPYALSRDYDRLCALLAERREIVCFVDYLATCRDVATARCFADDNYIRVGARGIQYNNPLVTLEEKEKFYADCKSINLEFIDPVGATDILA